MRILSSLKSPVQITKNPFNICGDLGFIYRFISGLLRIYQKIPCLINRYICNCRTIYGCIFRSENPAKIFLVDLGLDCISKACNFLRHCSVRPSGSYYLPQYQTVHPAAPNLFLPCLLQNDSSGIPDTGRQPEILLLHKRH